MKRRENEGKNVGKQKNEEIGKRKKNNAKEI